MTVLYVTSNEPGAGRTIFCAALAKSLLSQGKQVAICKPLSLATGENGEEDTDAIFLTNVCSDQPNHREDYGHWPIALTPDHGEDPGQSVSRDLLQKVVERVRQLEKDFDAVILEGLPENDGSGKPIAASCDLANAINARVISVLRFNPGMTSEEATLIPRRFQGRFTGLLLNQVTRYSQHVVSTKMVPEIIAQDIPVLSVIKEDRRLLSPTVRQIGDYLQGRFVVGNRENEALVEHFMIGGLVLESGRDYFGAYEDKAVIVRGDRPDIQLAALDTPTQCLILTGGYEPIPYVRYQAQETNIPIIVVAEDTLATVTLLENLTPKITVHHAEKVRTFQELLAKSAFPTDLLDRPTV